MLRQARTGKAVADALEIPWRQLKHLLYDIPESSRYKTWTIPKKTGGTRTIESPRKGILLLQKKAASILEIAYRPGPWVKAFTKGSSVTSNAAIHCRKRWVLNIDLEDFYGAINFGRIRGLLMKKPFNIPQSAASVLSHLLAHKNHLPQGAPSSPLVSNMAAWVLDKHLIRIAKKHKLTYSRYADDITLSSTRQAPPPEIISWEGTYPAMTNLKIGQELSNAILRSGFKPNLKKLRLLPASVRQDVTGLTVNTMPNVRRCYIRNLRAMLNSWEKRGIVDAELHHIKNFAINAPDINEDEMNGKYFKSVIYGHMAWLKSVSAGEGQVYLGLCSRIAKLDSNPPKFILDGKENFNMFDFFICHAGEDKASIATPIAEVLEQAGYTIFIDNLQIKWGDSFVQRINSALGRSKYVIAVLSSRSVNKAWPMKEVNAIIANEIGRENMRLLPLMVGSKTDIDKILKMNPLLDDKHYLIWDGDPAKVLAKAISLIPRPSTDRVDGISENPS